MTMSLSQAVAETMPWRRLNLNDDNEVSTAINDEAWRMMTSGALLVRRCLS
jgi:hypothetical protein